MKQKRTRQADHQTRLIASGSKRVSAWLLPKEAEALDAFAEKNGMSRAAAIRYSINQQTGT